MRHYVANVCHIPQMITMGQVVPCEDDYETVDKSRPVLSFLLLDGGEWEPQHTYNLETEEEGNFPPCFKPAEEILEALDRAAATATEDNFGIGKFEFSMS